jgi:hypothetical protein
MMRNNDPDNWAEPLPHNCPPDQAQPPNGQEFFRLVKKIPLEKSDFYSHKKLYPDRRSRDQCIARGVSVFSDLTACKNAGKLPNLKHYTAIVKIRPPLHSGLVLQTGAQPTHYSWWLSKNYDPISDSKPVF